MKDLDSFLELIPTDSLVSENSRFSLERVDNRQASESIKVLAQISYLTVTDGRIAVSLATEDASALFKELTPVNGNHLSDPAAEVLRLAALYQNVIEGVELSYPATVITNEVEAGFSEGGRVKRTQLTLERNARIRRAFFDENPSAVCDFCDSDTERKYPWTSRVLDIHHLLPLCSGVRTGTSGTVLKDVVANCPTCHRAVHRYYDVWLSKNDRADFVDADEARMVYQEAKKKYLETI